MSINIRKEVTALTILVLYISLYILFIKVLILVVDFSQPIRMISYLMIYLFLFIIIQSIAAKFPYRVLMYIVFIISFPIIVFKLFTPVISMVKIIGAYFIASILIPLIIAVVVFQFLNASYENMLFVFLASSSIISILFNKNINTSILKLSARLNKDSLVEDDYEIRNLVQNVLTPANIRVSIYSAYFFYLCLYTIFYFENISIFDSVKIDQAVMQAFFAFLAFDNMKIVYNDLKGLPSSFLDQLIKIIFHEEKRDRVVEHEETEQVVEHKT